MYWSGRQSLLVDHTDILRRAFEKTRKKYAFEISAVVRHVEYCYINPIKHGLVRRVQDWSYSSFHVRRGIFPLDWAGDFAMSGIFGERA
jgi:hypothetical protein